MTIDEQGAVPARRLAIYIGRMPDDHVDSSHFESSWSPLMTVIRDDEKIEILSAIDTSNLSEEELTNNLIKAKERISSAMMRVIADHPFYSTLLLRFERVFTRDIPTMAVNSRRLWINPEFVLNCFKNVYDINIVLVHEAMHILLGHSMRRGTRDPELWNIAGDYVINGILVKNGYRMPGHGLHNPGFSGMTTETVYSLIWQTERFVGIAWRGRRVVADGDGNTCADGNGTRYGQLLDRYGMGGVDDEDPGASPLEAKILIASTLATGRKDGTLPRDFGTLMKATLQPVVDWRQRLRDLLTTQVRTDYCYRMPNRRNSNTDVFLPSLERCDSIGDLVVAIDNSGSIDLGAYDSFLSEVSALVQDLRPQSVTVLYCDDAINGVKSYVPEDMPITDAPSPGGGTNFGPVFEYVDTQEIAPTVLIYFTDLGVSRYPADPGYPVIWACQPGSLGRSSRQPPFGVTFEVGATL